MRRTFQRVVNLSVDETLLVVISIPFDAVTNIGYRQIRGTLNKRAVTSLRHYTIFFVILSSRTLDTSVVGVTTVTGIDLLFGCLIIRWSGYTCMAACCRHAIVS